MKFLDFQLCQTQCTFLYKLRCYHASLLSQIGNRIFMVWKMISIIVLVDNFSSTEFIKILQSVVRNLQISTYWVKNSSETTNSMNCDSITSDLVSNCSDVCGRIALLDNCLHCWTNHCAVDEPFSFCREYLPNSDLSGGKVCMRNWKPFKPTSDTIDLIVWLCEVPFWTVV